MTCPWLGKERTTNGVSSVWMTLCYQPTSHTSPPPATAVTNYISNSKIEWQKTAKNCTLLGYYIVSSGNFLPTFWDNLSVPSSGFKNLQILLVSWTMRMGPTGCPKTLVRNYHYSLHNKWEERISQLLRAWSLKSGTEGRRQVAICIPSFTDLTVDSERITVFIIFNLHHTRELLILYTVLSSTFT